MPAVSAERAEQDAIWRNQEAQLRADNLKMIGNLGRPELLRFLEKPRGSKDNTEKLRISARRLAAIGPSADVAKDLMRILT